MNEEKHKRAMTIALVSESAGMLFTIAGVWIGGTLLFSGYLTGGFGMAMLAADVLPTLGVALLLIVAGQILRAVVDNSNQ